MKKENAKMRYIGKIIAAFLFGAAIMVFVRYISYGGMVLCQDLVQIKMRSSAC